MTTPVPPIAILRPGTFTDIHGQTVSFGATEIAEIAASYDEQSAPAPLVIGHPKINAPAWGWVKGMHVDGDTLFATPDHLEPAFAEAVRAKRYRKISASFYPPDSAASPTPGKWSLKHVGFLGAHAPAIKGLGTVSFAAGDDEAAVTFIHDDKEKIMDPTAEEVAFAERENDIVTKETAIADREQALLVREATLIASERAAVHDGHVAFAEQQVEAGKLAPAGRELVIGLLDTLSTQDAVSFGEAGELAPADAFRKLFDGAGTIVSFGELAPAEPETPVIEQTAEEKASMLADKAREFAEAEAKAGRTITIAQAVRHVAGDDA